MKLSLFTLSSVFTAVSSAAVAPRAPWTCPDRTTAVDLAHAVNAAGNNFYTTNTAEFAGGYTQADTNTAQIYPVPASGPNPVNTVTFYRYFSTTADDHYYTTQTGAATITRHGNSYTLDGPQGLTLTKSGIVFCGAVPLYELFKAPKTGEPATAADHLYTTSIGELTSASIKGYKYEGIAAYVLPPQPIVVGAGR
ncbi:hypothetical protein HGRIS_003636 [Hohenbuehelia grisea]|uniref:DUF5648 domain-containing protein n=1 Tax=Hohenbuehelia grisea TaxID=104357 RepID=A0ABR3JHM9_9AGAR